MFFTIFLDHTITLKYTIHASVLSEDTWSSGWRYTRRSTRRRHNLRRPRRIHFRRWLWHLLRRLRQRRVNPGWGQRRFRGIGFRIRVRARSRIRDYFGRYDRVGFRVTGRKHGLLTGNGRRLDFRQGRELGWGPLRVFGYLIRVRVEHGDFGGVGEEN